MPVFFNTRLLALVTPSARFHENEKSLDVTNIKQPLDWVYEVEAKWVTTKLLSKLMMKVAKSANNPA